MVSCMVLGMDVSSGHLANVNKSGDRCVSLAPNLITGLQAHELLFMSCGNPMTLRTSVLKGRGGF